MSKPHIETICRTLNEPPKIHNFLRNTDLTRARTGSQSIR